MNKLTLTMSALCALTAVSGCNKNTSDDEVIEKPDVEIVNGMITPEVLEAFGRVSSAVVSHDGKEVAFTLGYENIEKNKSNSEIYL
ncbi:MAG: peptidase S9, partial [Muribaculaceae bacterium]|nr:peptidase S9 [Muribaculaceae bacterium]